MISVNFLQSLFLFKFSAGGVILSNILNLIMADYNSTHPNLRATQSGVTCEELSNDIRDAIQLALPSNAPSYSKVTVLMVTWEHLYASNEAGIRDDYLQLRNLMTNHFNYAIEEHFLDESMNRNEQCRRSIQKCLDVIPDLGELLIFYYIGHSAFHANEHTYLG